MLSPIGLCVADTKCINEIDDISTARLMLIEIPVAAIGFYYPVGITFFHSRLILETSSQLISQSHIHPSHYLAFVSSPQYSHCSSKLHNLYITSVAVGLW